MQLIDTRVTPETPGMGNYLVEFVGEIYFGNAFSSDPVSLVSTAIPGQPKEAS